MHLQAGFEVWVPPGGEDTGKRGAVMSRGVEGGKAGSLQGAEKPPTG